MLKYYIIGALLLALVGILILMFTWREFPPGFQDFILDFLAQFFGG